MKLILSSCDFNNDDSKNVIIENLCKSISECKVLYFPNEKVTLKKIKSGKYEDRISAFGFQKENIYVANYFDPTPFLNLDIDAIYISGGNTFGTIKLIRDSGFDKAIVNYVQSGVIYVGGSAGAHIVTADISHVEKYDKDTFGLTDFSGLGLFDGILICHYNEERKVDFKALKALNRYKVIVLRDDQSIIIENK